MDKTKIIAEAFGAAFDAIAAAKRNGADISATDVVISMIDQYSDYIRSFEEVPVVFGIAGSLGKGKVLEGGKGFATLLNATTIKVGDIIALTVSMRAVLADEDNSKFRQLLENIVVDSITC